MGNDNTTSESFLYQHYLYTLQCLLRRGLSFFVPAGEMGRGRSKRAEPGEKGKWKRTGGFSAFSPPLKEPLRRKEHFILK